MGKFRISLPRGSVSLSIFFKCWWLWACALVYQPPQTALGYISPTLYIPLPFPSYSSPAVAAGLLVQAAGTPAQVQSCLSASSSYEEKALLSASLAFLDGSLQGLKSPGLPQERQRTCGWGHGRGEGGSFDLGYGSKTMIETECGSTGS